MKVEHILIRCAGCGQTPCTVSCSSNALAYIYGDLLIEASKCTACDKKEFPIPACIRGCQNSGDKQVLKEVSLEEKRTAAASALPLLSI